MLYHLDRNVLVAPGCNGRNEHEPAYSKKPSYNITRACPWTMAGPPLRGLPFVQQIAQEWQSPKAPAGMSMTPPGGAEGWPCQDLGPVGATDGHWASRSMAIQEHQINLTSRSTLTCICLQNQILDSTQASLSSDRANPGSSCPQTPETPNRSQRSMARSPHRVELTGLGLRFHWSHVDHGSGFSSTMINMWYFLMFQCLGNVGHGSAFSLNSMFFCT